MLALHGFFNAAIVLSGFAVQTEPVQEPAPTAVDEVVVSGRSLKQTVETFVSEITSPPPGHGPARWNRQICVGVVNLRVDAAQVVIDQVSQAADLVGLEPAGPGCRPNILVIATDDANGLANALVDGQPRTFRPQYSGASQSARALEAFRSTSEPVRWWHVSMPVTRDGSPAVRLPGNSEAPLIRGSGRLTTEVTNQLLRSFVILDISKMEGKTFQQVGDYVAMVSLAQITPDADTSSFNTVMNLFNTSAHSVALTDWDQAYLSALYGTYLNERNPNAQLGTVGSAMFHDWRAAERAASVPKPVP